MAFSVCQVRIPFIAPLRTATTEHAERRLWLLRATDPDGVSGYGEAAPLAGHGGGDPDAVEGHLARLCALLEGLDPDRLDDRGELERFRCRLAEAGLAARAPSALAAIDQALVDLAARRAGISLARWLNPGAVGSVRVNATLGADDPVYCANEARAAVRDGFQTLKVKLAGRDSEDLERVRAVRSAVGVGVALRADANGAWSVERAERMLSELSSSGLEYVEQPVAARDVAGMAALRGTSPVPIAADEALLLPGGPRSMFESRAADVWIVKPTLCGGPWATSSLLDMAAEAGAESVITSALDSAVGRAGALHLAAATLGGKRACGLATGSRLAWDVGDAPPVSGGWLTVPRATGLGISVSPPGGVWHDVEPARGAGR